MGRGRNECPHDHTFPNDGPSRANWMYELGNVKVFAVGIATLATAKTRESRP